MELDSPTCSHRQQVSARSSPAETPLVASCGLHDSPQHSKRGLCNHGFAASRYSHQSWSHAQLLSCLPNISLHFSSCTHSALLLLLSGELLLITQDSAQISLSLPPFVSCGQLAALCPSAAALIPLCSSYFLPSPPCSLTHP